MKSAPPMPSLKPEHTLLNAYLNQVGDTLDRLEWEPIDDALTLLRDLKARGGRLFILGVGGSAANASHAVNDFRKIAGIEAYAPTDNVAELTARTNDEGWERVFWDWLLVSRCSAKDAILVLSVGGGSKSASPNLIHAISTTDADVIGIVGPTGGDTAEWAEVCVKIPAEAPYITPLVESFQPLIWHYWVNAL